MIGVKAAGKISTVVDKGYYDAASEVKAAGKISTVVDLVVVPHPATSKPLAKFLLL